MTQLATKVLYSGRFLAIAAFAVALPLSACATETDTSARPAPSEASDPSSATPAATTAPTPGPPATSTFAVGDVITISENDEPWADFTVIEVQQAAEFVDPNGFFNDTPQTDGYVFLSARVRYQALTDGVTYNPFDFQVFIDGQAVESFTFALYGPEPDLSSGTLPQGRTAEGWLLYEVPPTGEVLLSYSGNVFLNEAPIFEVVLREG